MKKTMSFLILFLFICSGVFANFLDVLSKLDPATCKNMIRVSRDIGVTVGQYFIYIMAADIAADILEDEALELVQDFIYTENGLLNQDGNVLNQMFSVLSTCYDHLKNQTGRVDGYARHYFNRPYVNGGVLSTMIKSIHDIENYIKNAKKNGYENDTNVTFTAITDTVKTCSKKY